MISTSHFHPMLVHFPIALVVFGFIAEVAAIWFKKEIYLSRFGFYLLLAGTISALFALATGTLFTAEMEGAAAEIQETHELFAWITLSTLLISSALRIYLEVKKSENSGLQRIAFVLYGVGAIAVSITGFYGGSLVYDYMMPI